MRRYLHKDHTSARRAHTTPTCCADAPPAPVAPGVHSRYNQLKQFVDGAAKEGAKRIRIHILTDGRDVPDGSSIGFVEQLEKDLKEVSASGCDAKIASGGGRMGVTMDRYEVG